MPNRLFLRPTSLHAAIDDTLTFEWALYDVAGNQAGSQKKASLEELQQVLMQNGLDLVEVHLFWPAISAFTTFVDLPGNQARYLNQALPFAVEEQLAQDIDSVHLVAGSFDKELGFPVACVDKNLFTAVYELIGAVELFQLKSVSLDASVLSNEQQDMTIALGASQVWVQSRRNQAIGLSRDNLVPYLDSIFLGTVDDKATDSDSFSIKLYVEESEREAASLLIAELEQYPSVELDTEDITLSMFEFVCELWMRRAKPPLNLCQGEFKIQNAGANAWYKWRGIAAILVLGFVVQLGVFSAQGYHYRQQAEAITHQAVSEYQKAVPGSKNVSADKLARIIKGKLNSRGNQGKSEAGFLDLLGEAGYQFSRSPSKQSISFSAINYNKQRGELVLEMRAKSFEQLDALKGALVDAGLGAKISSAVQDEGMYKGRINVSGS